VAELIDEGPQRVDFIAVRGDAWPDEPLVLVMKLADGTPIPSYVESGRLQVRGAADDTAELAAVTSADAGLTVAGDGSGITIPAGCVPAEVTKDWPPTDFDAPVKERTPLVYDLEVIRPDGRPDTLIGGTISVKADVTR
jgi:hypothetical protein